VGACISEPSSAACWPGRQRIACDVVRAKLLRQHFRVVVDASFGCRVERPPISGMASSGRYIDDLARLALSHPYANNIASGNVRLETAVLSIADQAVSCIKGGSQERESAYRSQVTAQPDTHSVGSGWDRGTYQ
jgi:hypothetical protein